MLSEWQEYLDYTGTVTYQAAKKNDSAWRGRFSFEALIETSGLVRILAIIARRYLFHDAEGNIFPDDPRCRIDLAHQAMCAWCSIPDEEGAEHQPWNHRTDFRELHADFPDLVDADGYGWFCRHFCAAMTFAISNPDLVRSGYPEKATDTLAKFPQDWRNKVIGAHYSVLDPSTKASWLLRFDDILADALELGPLRNHEIELPQELKDRVLELLPKTFPAKNAPMVYEMIAYYISNKPDDSDWVVLPVTNFDCFFGDSNFSHSYLAKIPEDILVREHKYGISRYRGLPDFLP